MKLSELITRATDMLYIRPVRKIIPRQTFRYLVCGVLNLVLGWLIYYLLFHFIVRGRWLDLGFVMMSPHTLSLFIQYPITFFTGFWLNRYVTFTLSPLRGRTQLLRYLLQTIGSFVVNYLFLKLFVDVAGIYPTVAKPVADIITIIYSYLTAKYFTFRGSREDER